MDDLAYRLTHDLLGRIGGPMTFRVIFQPLMSASFAVRDGIKDAKTGRPAYFWSFFTDPSHIGERLHECWTSISKIFFLALVLDVIYQVTQFHRFYLGEALITAVVLAMIPYILLRGPIGRIARYWRGGSSIAPSSSRL
jgi:hypothetical protein